MRKHTGYEPCPRSAEGAWLQSPCSYPQSKAAISTGLNEPQVLNSKCLQSWPKARLLIAQGSGQAWLRRWLAWASPNVPAYLMAIVSGGCQVALFPSLCGVCNAHCWGQRGCLLWGVWVYGDIAAHLFYLSPHKVITVLTIFPMMDGDIAF